MSPYQMSTNPAKIIALEVGERKFKCNEDTLTAESEYFASQLSGTWTFYTQADGFAFIDRDGDMFEHILRFMRTGIYPLFYKPKEGHDLVLYNRVLVEARYFLVGKLVSWLESEMYYKAITIERTSAVKEDDASESTSNGTGNITECIPTWSKEKVYICPRNIFIHRGHPNSCGKDCRKKWGDEGPEYSDEMVLRTVEITSKTKLLQHAVST